MEPGDTRRRVADMVGEASSGAVSPVDALAADASLFDLGLDSLGWLRLIDAVEIGYGVDLTLGGRDLRVVTADQIVDLLQKVMPEAQTSPTETPL